MVYVKRKSRRERRHPNAIWAELKRKYGFYKYEEMDCATFERIKRDIDQENILIINNIKSSMTFPLKSLP